MQTIKIHKDKLVHPEKNVRIHGDKQLTEMRKSVKMFGQIRPVVTDESYTILAGNGLVMAVREMEEIQELDVLVMKNLSDNDKVKLMIADNKIYGLGFDDNESIMELLESLDGDFTVPGYDEELLNELLADADEVDEQINTFGVMNDEERSVIENRGERLNKQIDERQEYKENETEEQEYNRVTSDNAKNSMISDIPINNNSSDYYAEDTEDNIAYAKQDVVKTVTCPHCNKIIEL